MYIFAYIELSYSILRVAQTEVCMSSNGNTNVNYKKTHFYNNIKGRQKNGQTHAMGFQIHTWLDTRKKEFLFWSNVYLSLDENADKLCFIQNMERREL